MKLIESSYEIIEQEPGLEGIYKAIERAGRTCYKSEDKITDTSAKEFVDRMINSGHHAMLEHGTIYLAIPMTTYAPDAINNYNTNPYSKVTPCNDFIFTDKFGDKVCAWCITTNFRVLVENNCLEDLEFLCEPTEYHEKRVTVKFTCDRGVSHEFVRHRVFSFAQESTRYCNYSKDKFGNELTFIKPSWYTGRDMSVEQTGSLVSAQNDKEVDFQMYLKEAEGYYISMIKQDFKPQEARAMLPNCLKTELVMTGFLSDWDHFFELRDSKAAHPDAYKLAHPLHEEFNERYKNI